ncbi:hypothetical protein AVEN_161870-1 [Araneus ventricosus]|uniref:Uncharacterized protein n=1 Tax=Araneus ventricosus TaxID=182803 RepID=A0A4Y2Q459_ARAVE|nr:hypothetical protein AVEN_161870-1 [Araneus ventricosus]
MFTNPLRHNDFISQYSTDIRHVKESKNVVADSLSQIKLNSIIKSLFPNFSELAEAEQNDPETQNLLQDKRSSLQLALKPCLSTNSDLICEISTVLLGIRIAVKEDIKAVSAELVYGTTFQLPNDMIETFIIPPCDDIFVDRLRNAMREMNPVATSEHGKTKFYVNPSLKTFSHVFLRIDSVKPLLCQPYTGPHKVLKRTENFTIEMNGRTSTVSIDRVKPAYAIPTCEEKSPILKAEKTVSPDTFQSDKHLSANQTARDKTVTNRSGRRVHFPSKLSTYITY